MDTSFVAQLGVALGIIGLIALVFTIQGLALNHRLTDGASNTLNLPLRLSLAFASGLTLAMVLAVALACAGVLNGGATLLIHGLVTAALLSWAGPAALASLVPERTDLLLLPFIAVVIALAPDIVVPPHTWDDTMYHLPYAREYLEAGGLVLDPYRRFPLLPHNLHLVFAQALALGGDDIVRGLCWLVGLSMVVLVWGAARHWLRDPLMAAGAVAVLLYTPMIRFHFTVAYVDQAMSLLVSAGIVAAGLWADTRQRGWLLLAGLTVGGAIGTKYFALPAFALIGLFILLYARRLRPALLFGVTALLVGGFWYVRNAWFSGNPVHPIASDLFGYVYWDAADMVSQYEEQALHGTGSGLWQLPLAAARASAIQVLAPAMVWLWAPRLSPGFKGMAAILLGAYLVWFFTSQVDRYLMPAVPLAGVVLMACFQPLVVPVRRFLTHPAAFAVLALAVCLYAGASAWQHGRFAAWVVATGEERFLAMAVKGADLMQEAARRLADDPDPTIFQVDFESATYYFPGQVVGDWFGPGRYRQLFREADHSGRFSLPPGDELAEILERHDADLLVIGNRVIDFDPQALAPQFETVYTDEWGWILAPRALPRSTGETMAYDLHNTTRHR